jgi:hypothetical protein
MTTLLIKTARQLLAAALITSAAAMTLSAQAGSETISQPTVNAGGANAASHEAESEPPPKRIFGIVPNYRSSLTLEHYAPITPREKFAIARQDSFDRGTVILGVLLGGEAQLTKSTPSFGQGAPASAKYFAASFSDFVIGNYMTEAVFPTLLHQDPRYFRRETGSVWSRLGSAAGQVFWTRADSGRMQLNISEIGGASAGVALSNIYYRDNRNASDAATRLGVQISADVVGNVLKEFSPELSRLFSRKHDKKGH